MVSRPVSTKTEPRGKTRFQINENRRVATNSFVISLSEENSSKFYEKRSSEFSDAFWASRRAGNYWTIVSYHRMPSYHRILKRLRSFWLKQLMTRLWPQLILNVIFVVTMEIPDPSTQSGRESGEAIFQRWLPKLHSLSLSQLFSFKRRGRPDYLLFFSFSYKLQQKAKITVDEERIQNGMRTRGSRFSFRLCNH